MAQAAGRQYHPGATYPFGMVSVCAYSALIPLATGSTSSTPRVCPHSSTTPRSPPVSPISSSQVPERSASTTTTSGLRPCWSHSTASATPGSCTTSGLSRATTPRPQLGIGCELTVGPKSAVHRYTFPAHKDARLVIDFSMGGLAIPYGTTVPARTSKPSHRASPKPRSSWKVHRWRCTWSATPAT